MCCKDGNAKLWHAICGSISLPSFGIFTLICGCSQSLQHKGGALRAPTRTHQLCASLSASPLLEAYVRPTRRQPASTIASDVVQAYFSNFGEQVVQDAKTGAPRSGAEPCQVLVGNWSSQDPQEICGCRTYSWPRSAGFLTVVSESGFNGRLYEVITSETLSQGCCFLAQVADDVPDLQTAVDDDASTEGCRSSSGWTRPRPWDPDVGVGRQGSWRGVNVVPPVCQEGTVRGRENWS